MRPVAIKSKKRRNISSSLHYTKKVLVYFLFRFSNKALMMKHLEMAIELARLVIFQCTERKCILMIESKEVTRIKKFFALEASTFLTIQKSCNFYRCWIRVCNTDTNCRIRRRRRIVSRMRLFDPCNCTLILFPKHLYTVFGNTNCAYSCTCVRSITRSRDNFMHIVLWAHLAKYCMCVQNTIPPYKYKKWTCHHVAQSSIFVNNFTEYTSLKSKI